jgi:hypothetical protein
VANNQETTLLGADCEQAPGPFSYYKMDANVKRLLEEKKVETEVKK